MSENLLLSSSWQHTYCKITMSSSITVSTCFDWVWISTTIGVWHMYWINYKLQVPKWILIKSDEISGKHCKMKVQVYYCSSHLYMLTSSERDLVLHNTIFYKFAVSDWNDVPVLLYTVWLYHLISQINNSAGFVSLMFHKSWKLCQ